ncbi:MAG TPA: glycosyltransferase [Gammaproteobacteria bacterium]|nr:glycosyltransferase [Gammaproteobacteria bacterium]
MYWQGLITLKKIVTQKNKQLIVFVKAPIAGQCKTRLAPLLGPDKASEFYRTLVEQCFENIQTINNIDIAIYATPDTRHPFIQALGKKYTSTLKTQQGHDLGERMHAAIDESLQHYSQTVLTGTDCAVISQQYIEQAFESLKHHDIVFGPAEDGGYVLIGARKIQPALFQNINWGTDRVLEQNLHNCHTCAYNTHLLETLWDIDTPDDFLRYQNHKHRKE